jgi:hypothetical protein
MEPETVVEEDALWDELLGLPESLALLERLAAQALQEHAAGQTIPLDELLEQSEGSEESDTLCE